jgi:hypothetical protein
MTFPTVIFGSISVTGPSTYTFTDGGSISTGGFILYIVPTINVGAAGIGIGFTYINQFGVTKTTSVSTAVASGTTSGTHVKVVLEPGDTGIRDITGISYFTGGTAGDALNFQSSNEGLGTPAFDLILTDPFDRSVPGSFMEEPYPFQFTGNTHDITSVIPDLYYSNPQVQMELSISNLAAYFPELMIDRGIPVIEEGVTKTTEIIEWITEPTMRTLTGYEFVLFKSWLESIVGQVVSGYIANTNNEIIYNAIKLVLISPTASTGQPGGISDALPVDPVTGLYQAFIKNVSYTDRYVIVQAGIGKYTSLKGGGTPTYINGSQTLPVPYNLQFECPTIECDFDVTRKQ